MTKLVPLVLTLLVAMTLPSLLSKTPSQAMGLDPRQQTSTRGDSGRRHGLETPHSGSPGSVTGSVISSITQRTDSSPTVVLPRWPMQGHDAQRTGRVNVSGPVTATVAWTYQFNDDVLFHGRLQDQASPIVGPDGTIYQPTEGFFYAINPDGTFKWSLDFSSFGMRNAAALSPDGNTVYIIDQTIAALEAQTGSVLWRYALGAGEDVSYSSMAVDGNGTIYVGTRVPAALYAVHPDGTLKWRYAVPGGASLGIEAAPAIDVNGNVYVEINSTGLVALDADGNYRWTAAPGGDYGWFTPTIGPDGTIYVAGDHDGQVPNQSATALNPDGSLKWQRSASEIGAPGFFAGMAISADGSTVYTGRGNGKVYALNAATGATQWMSQISTWDSLSGSPALGDNGVLYLTSNGGELYAVWTGDGSLLWQYELETYSLYWGAQSPALGPDGTLYAVSSGLPPASGGIRGRLYAFKDSGCWFMLSSMSQSFLAAGGTGSTNVTAGEPGCNWTAVSNDTFITITSGSSGSGNGTVDYSVEANPSASPRSGTMTIAGRTFRVNQAGIPLTLGNYPNTSVSVGANTTVTPDAAPTSNTSINGSAASAFKGMLAANPTTGVVQVTNAQPAGSYMVTVTAFNAAGETTAKTFTLTVTNPTHCDSMSFSAASGSPFAVGSLPAFGAVGDFNGDGNQDFAVANWGSNNMTVLLGNGSGGFSAATGSPFAVGSHPASIAVADFNGDGRQDLAIANSGSHNVTVLLGDGGGSFSAGSGSPFSVGGLTPESVVMGDLNGDSKPDLAIANWNTNNVTVLLGNGSGGFSAASGSPFAVGTNPRSVAVGDFNGDGKTDLAAANYWGDNVTVLLGNGAGAFSPAIGSPFALAAGSHPDSVAVGDFNGDGKQDLTTANYLSNNVAVLLGDGSGGFSPAPGSPITVVANPYSVVVADYNGDGKLDLATANLGSNNASVLLGNGLGGFSISTGSPFAVGSGPICVAAGDFNGDGKLDLAAANQDSSNFTVLLNTCTSNTAPTISAVGVTRQQGSPSANATIANVNDLEDPATALSVTVNGGVSATVNGVTVSAISVSGSGVVTADVIASCTATTATFTLRVTDTGALFNEATLTVTVNANTAPTLTYASPQSVIFGGSLNVSPTAAGDNGTITGWAVQSGHGLTTAPTVDASGVVSITNAQPGGSHTITVRATDNCGLTTDAAFTLEVQPQPPTLGTYPNTTVALGANATVTPDAAPTNATSINVSSSTNFKGTFSADPATGVVRVTNAHPAGAHTMTVRAFNGSVINTTRTFTLTVQPGTACTGASIFTNAADSSVGVNPISVAIGDFNNDGQQDMAVANYGSDTVSIRLGDGLGGFSGTTSVSVGSSPYSVAIGDFNDDGKQDFAAANRDSNTVSIRLGDGLGGFSGTTEVSVGGNPRSVVIGDFNNDGKQDIAAANNGSATVSIRLGDGAGGFSGTTNVSVGFGPGSVAIGDFNNDGKQDIAVANSDSTTVSIRLGNGLGGFSGTTDVSVGSNPWSVAIGDFNSDGKQDIAVANYISNTVSIRLGDGLGGFTGTTEVSVGSSPLGVAIGDFNNDGKQDIAAANFSSNTISIRLGDGLGGFTGTTSVSVGSSPYGVAIGDFNNDGKQDIAAANFSSNTVSIRLGACNLPPTIAAATGLSRQQGSPASNSQIATVTDDGGNGSVSVTVSSANPSNGVTISNIVNTGGNVTADIVAGCTATTATFTLQASDGSSTATDTLTVTVTANTAPTLVYSSPQAVGFAGALNVTPTSASDNGTITGYAVQSGHGLTTPPTVDASGVVSITNAQPPGAHTLTIRATDNCGAFTDAAFTLNVGAMPTFSIDDVTQVETNSGATSFVFTVIKSGSTGLNSSVNFTTVDGTATTANNDYQTSADSLTFLPADTTKQITVLVNGDTTFEANEAFTVHLSGASGATISDADGAGTITNDDSAPTFVIDDVTHNEGNSSTTAFIFTVTKTGSTALNSSVNFITTDGTASTATGDYQFISDALTFSPTEMTKTITVLVNGDTTVEPDETFTVHLFAASGATIADADGTGTITNDDAAPPTLGNYPNTTVQAGANTTVTPDAAPTSATRMNVSTSSAFKGTFAASPTTGVVHATNAHPAGTYTVTVTAFSSAGVTTTKTFTLTITNPTHCDFLSFSGASGSPFAVGVHPWSVAVGDFNGDGRQDLAIANSSSNNVTVMLGNGSGGFSPASGSPLAIGTGPYSVAVGDFNGDGKLDLTTANQISNNVTLLLGNGSGGFSPATGSPFAVGSFPISVAVGDFNGDGKLDLTTANASSDGDVTVLLGNGSGGFSPAIGSPFAVGGLGPVSVAVGDFNGDGKLDLTTANAGSNSVTVLLGNGSGGFSPATGSPFVVGSFPYSVAVGDFNGDRKLDLTAANASSDNDVTVLLGNGSGGFSPAIGSPFDVGTYPRSVAVGDFNGDGKQDLATANYGSNNVTVLLGNGSGGFSPATGSPFAVGGSQPTSVAVGDFNGDGKLDLTTANQDSFNVTVLLNTCALNTAPTISAVGVARQQGSPSANATIANVNDLEDLETALIVTVNGGVNATVNGVTVSAISVSGSGVVTADVIANCSATTATFTLRVTDTLGLFNEATLTVTVNPNTAPTLTYSSPQAVVFGGSLNVSPTTTGDNGAVTYSVQAGHGLTPPPTVDASGVVSITTAQPAGGHTITIRATDNCGAFTDAAFTLDVGAMPTFAIDDVTHNEGNAGTTSYTFTVTKTGSTALNSSVNFTTVDGSATIANSDYQLNTGTLNFLPADTTKQITVLVNGDTAVEPDEAFTVHLSGPSGATISDPDGTGTIINDDCSVSLSNNSENFTAAGGAASVTLTTTSACAWTAVSNDAFITITSGASGLGNGTVNYSVAANTGPARTGTMTIAGQTFTVTQDSGCSFMLSSTSQNFVGGGGMNSVNVITATGCTWNAVSNDAFIMVTSGSSGAGNGTVNYSVSANTGPARTGTMTIAAQTFTVTQGSGCTFMLSSMSQDFVAAGGMNSVNVITAPGCTWTAVSNDAFITVDSGSPGSGNGTVNYSVVANINVASRIGTITVAGQTFTVNQAGAECTYSLDTTSQFFGAAGGTGNVSVMAVSGCNWSAVSNAPAFITVTSGSTGSGNGMVTYSVTPDDTIFSRTGTLTIAGHIFTVTQTADTDGDGIPDVVEAIEGTNPLVKDNDVFNNARLFVMQQYRDFLGREGDPAGISFWTTQINSGSFTRAQVIDFFFNSPEFQGTVSPVTRLYFAYFLRIPDYEGLLFWVTQYRNGASLDTISQFFAQSPEFQGRYGNLDNTQFVTLLYQNVLGRAPDPEGLAFWVGHLNSAAFTRGQVMLGFSESPEYKQASFNKVYVTMIYVGMLRRAPEQGGFDFWVNAMNNGASGLNLIQGFLTAPEYHSRFLP